MLNASALRTNKKKHYVRSLQSQSFFCPKISSSNIRCRCCLSKQWSPLDALLAQAVDSRSIFDLITFSLSLKLCASESMPSCEGIRFFYVSLEYRISCEQQGGKKERYEQEMDMVTYGKQEMLAINTIILKTLKAHKQVYNKNTRHFYARKSRDVFIQLVLWF